MAASDYKLCDLCECKVFYDANLNYVMGREAPQRMPYRQVGKPQLDNPTFDLQYSMRLDDLGDWAVLCKACAMTHKTAIVPITTEIKP